MVKGFENELLTRLRVLELTMGPSGGYAGRLYAKSGARVVKVQVGSTTPSIFRDQKKEKVETTSQLDVFETVRNLLEESWDIILWDSHLTDEFERLLANTSKSCIGVRIGLPQGVGLDEEYGLQALGGWTALTGDTDQTMIVGGYSASYLVGAHAATAGLLAIIEKTWSGQGRVVHINALTIAVSALEGAYSAFLETNTLRSKSGNRHHKLSPMSILPASDGWAFVGAPVDDKWELLSRWAELSPRLQWSTNEGRRADCQELENDLGKWARNMTREELFLTGQAFRLPFSKVQTPEELLRCPQLAARGSWEEHQSSISGIKLPWRVDSGPFLHTKNASFLHKESWKGLRILDLTAMWSGPYCTRLFADLGVEVIKVEAPHRPDGIRSNQGSQAPFFRELNRNKRGVQLDLRIDSDRIKLLEMVRSCDVLVENFSPRVMANFGLTSEELWNHQPGLTIVSLSAFGQTGPFRDFVGYGPTIEAMSGIAALTGSHEGIPWLPGFSISDIGAGIHGAFALAAAVFFQNRKMVGLKIDLSQYETACQFTADYLIEKKVPLKPKTPNFVRGIDEIVMDERVSNISIPGGPAVLGTPWESKGWDPPRQSPPDIRIKNGGINDEVSIS